VDQRPKDPPTTEAPPRWAASRERLTCSVKRSARLAVRDVFREARRDQRARHVPIDPWHDCVIAGRSGNDFADFVVRTWQLWRVAGECPQKVRARLHTLFERVVDATHLAHSRA
jgi:hypothetical protein